MKPISYLLLIMLSTFTILTSCRGGLSKEDQAFMERNCRGESCYMDFEKTNTTNPCAGTIVPLECQSRDPADTGSSGPPSTNTEGKGQEQSDTNPVGCGPDGCPGGLGDSGQNSGSNGTGGSGGSGTTAFVKATGDLLSGLGEGLASGWNEVKDELNGKNAEKRRKARDAKRLINEAKDLWEQSEKLASSIDANSKGIEASWALLQDSWNDFGLATRTDDLTGFRTRYNSRTTGILNGVPIADPSAFDGIGRGLGDGIYPESSKVAAGRKYLKYAKDKVNERPDRPDYAARQTLVSVGEAAMDSAESSYREGKIQEGNALAEFGIAAADMALSLTPIIGWGKDTYEAISGRGLLDNRKLTTFERSMAVVGVLTVGIGSKFAILGKGAKAVDILAQAAKGAEEAKIVAKAGATAERVIIEGEKLGFKKSIDAAEHVWVDEAGNLKWPLNRGFQGESFKEVLPPGKEIDRFGRPSGTFASPAGTSFEARSLPDSAKLLPLNKYRIIKSVEVDSGKAAPWFSQPGGGIQYELPESIEDLITFGFLEQIK